MGRPRVNYREAVTKRADFDYMHRKQSGGQGQFGRVRFESRIRSARHTTTTFHHSACQACRIQTVPSVQATDLLAASVTSSRRFWSLAA